MSDSPVSRAHLGAVVACGLLAAGTAGGDAPDAVYFNANIYTVDFARPRAAALAVRGERLIAVGSEAEILPLAGPTTRRIDLGQRTVLPGLIDSHCHFAGLGAYGLGRLDLSDARSFDDVVAAVAARVKKAKPGEWIRGGRWDHERWPGHKLPVHAALSAVSPDNPVWLTRVDGHAGLANAAAMKIAGVSAATTAPTGGEILRDEHGAPTGVFVDNAEELIASHAKSAGAGHEELILKAQEMCLALGLTGIHDAGIAPAEIDVYRRLAENGKLKIRVYVMVEGRRAPEYFAKHGLLIGDRLTVRAAKAYADGALGSRGALLLAPYADRPTDEHGQPYTGLAVDPELVRQLAEDGLRQGYQVCTHAIGDRGNRDTLDAYAAALAKAAQTTAASAPAGAPRPDPRFRIEHAQVLAPEDIPRFATLGVIAAMQPTHCTSDMRWVDDRLGPARSAGAYAWASLLRSGVRVAGGSDFPVESPNPMLGIYAAVTRQDQEGAPAAGWHPQERMTRAEALRAFTLDAAYAGFQEASKGALVAGKLADFIVVDRDIMTCEPREISGARVLLTVIGGEEVCRTNAGGPRAASAGDKTADEAARSAERP